MLWIYHFKFILVFSCTTLTSRLIHADDTSYLSYDKNGHEITEDYCPPVAKPESKFSVFGFFNMLVILAVTVANLINNINITNNAAVMMDEDNSNSAPASMQRITGIGPTPDVSVRNEVIRNNDANDGSRFPEVVQTSGMVHSSTSRRYKNIFSRVFKSCNCYKIALSTTFKIILLGINLIGLL